jgi:hypothetical protein
VSRAFAFGLLTALSVGFHQGAVAQPGPGGTTLPAVQGTGHVAAQQIARTMQPWPQARGATPLNRCAEPASQYGLVVDLSAREPWRAAVVRVGSVSMGADWVLRYWGDHNMGNQGFCLRVMSAGSSVRIPDFPRIVEAWKATYKVGTVGGGTVDTAMVQKLAEEVQRLTPTEQSANGQTPSSVTIQAEKSGQEPVQGTGNPQSSAASAAGLIACDQSARDDRDAVSRLELYKARLDVNRQRCQSSVRQYGAMSFAARADCDQAERGRLALASAQAAFDAGAARRVQCAEANAAEAQRQAAALHTAQAEKEARLQAVRTERDPKTLFLMAGRLERENEVAAAMLAYQRLLDDFPQSEWSVQANKRLIREREESRQRELERERARQQQNANCLQGTFALCMAGCPLTLRDTTCELDCRSRCPN